MKMIDSVAGVVASRHARSVVVTASIDRLDFIAPGYVGDLIVLKANLNYVGTSSKIGAGSRSKSHPLFLKRLRSKEDLRKESRGKKSD